MQQRRSHAMSGVSPGSVLRTLRTACLWLPLLLVSFSGPVSAASPNGTTLAEIGHLLAYLGDSGCEFYRNGTWYGAVEARQHLEKKKDYLMQRSMISSTEDFIERAATQSSMSGETYQVRCRPNPAVSSNAWLKAELKKYRSR